MKNEIKNYDSYNERMSASLIDKVFFADKIPLDISLIVDYGCADGFLLNFIKRFFPDAILIGYDKDEKMIESAKSNTDGIEFYSDWNEVLKRVNDIDHKGAQKAILASSLIHEVYAYGKYEDILKFWDDIYCGAFDYICVRDMMVSMSVDRPSDINDIVRVLRRYHRTKALLDFQANWGSIENNKNLIHFLLKYRYMEPNWEREVKENYLPLYKEDFLSNIPQEYDIIFYEHYTLPFLKEQVKKDMSVILKDPTHIKIIMKKEK
jgi:SAM-dependent methyltransferase